MVAFYKHDIPLWMDGTESLDAEPYRAYHVIIQLIYLAEGPIVLNEHGIAGRCKQSIRTFRASLKVLLDAEKIFLIDGRLSNSRAKKELEKISENRLNAAKGGHNSSGVPKSPTKPLENKTSKTAPLLDDNSLKEKRREEKTRQERQESAPALDPVLEKPDARVFRTVREIVKHHSAGMIAKKLLEAKNQNIPECMAAIEIARGADDPKKFLWGVIRKGTKDNDRYADLDPRMFVTEQSH